MQPCVVVWVNLQIYLCIFEPHSRCSLYVTSVQLSYVRIRSLGLLHFGVGLEWRCLVANSLSFFVIVAVLSIPFLVKLRLSTSWEVSLGQEARLWASQTYSSFECFCWFDQQFPVEDVLIRHELQSILLQFIYPYPAVTS